MTMINFKDYLNLTEQNTRLGAIFDDQDSPHKNFIYSKDDLPTMMSGFEPSIENALKEIEKISQSLTDSPDTPEQIFRKIIFDINEKMKQSYKSNIFASNQWDVVKKAIASENRLKEETVNFLLQYWNTFSVMRRASHSPFQLPSWWRIPVDEGDDSQMRAFKDRTQFFPTKIDIEKSVEKKVEDTFDHIGYIDKLTEWVKKELGLGCSLDLIKLTYKKQKSNEPIYKIYIDAAITAALFNLTEWATKELNIGSSIKAIKDAILVKYKQNMVDAVIEELKKQNKLN